MENRFLRESLIWSQENLSKFPVGLKYKLFWEFGAHLQIKKLITSAEFLTGERQLCALSIGELKFS